VKKKKLEILLQKVPLQEKPIPNLEQYMTPANIAADIIFIAHQFGDIEDKNVIDLGCGTGIFAVGALLTGAEKVTGIDVEKNSINLARKYAQDNNLNIEYLIQDVENVTLGCHTVIMNPPFGAQKSNIKADRKFIEKGFEIAKVIYSLHLSKTIPFIKKMISSLGGSIDYSKDYIFPIPKIFDFHEEKTKNYEVTLIRIKTNNKR
jgi:putative methylase